MAYPLLKGDASIPIIFGPVILSSDHVSPATGLAGTLAVTISKNGAGFAAPSGALSEISAGWYKLAGNATDTNTAGPLAVHATVATADPFDQMVAFVLDPTVQLFGVNVVAINSVSTGPVTSVKAVQGLSVADTIATYTGNTPQSGDSFARIGANGASLTALGDVRLANLDATISSRSTFSGGAVASVTGNVGGNVLGSVASLVAIANANIVKVNGIVVNGDGTSGNPWGP
jgi:hypothetical protein